MKRRIIGSPGWSIVILCGPALVGLVAALILSIAVIVLRWLGG